jgi:hypothetical protein
METTFRVGERPGPHIIAGDVIKFDLLQFMDAVVQDDGILPGLGEVAKAAAEVKADGTSSEPGAARGAGRGMECAGMLLLSLYFRWWCSRTSYKCSSIPLCPVVG